jgi:hypothetical protein
MAEHARKLVYILGSGRCGSTLLDVVLGAHPEIRSTGELEHLPDPAWSEGCTCSCGLSTLECGFWSGVRRRYEASAAAEPLRAGKARYGRVRHLGKLVTYRAHAPGHFREHVGAMRALADAIAAESGKPIVVDSSKNPGRGVVWSHAAGEGLEVYFLHLVRDGRGYVYSTATAKDSAPSPWYSSTPRASLQWMATNLACSAPLIGPGARYLRVRYEDVVAEPVPALQRIGRFLGVELGGVAARVAGREGFAPEHLVGGNRLRMHSQIVVRPDFKWERELSERDRALFWRVAGPLASHYGYRKTV